MSQHSLKVSIKGHVLIKDSDGKVILDKKNAIHNKNMAIVIARGLANEPPSTPSAPGISQIYQLKLGNGGSTIDSLNQITYQAPNILGSTADLYNTTYAEVVDEQQTGTPVQNSVTYQEAPAPDETAIVIVSATISAGEPAGQPLSNAAATSLDGDFVFDELGLFTSDGKMISHLIFSPIIKTAEKELIITYTLTIEVS